MHMSTTPLVLLATLVILATFTGGAAAQKADAPTGANFTCSTLSAPTDPTCSLFSPLSSALPPSSTEGYIGQMKAAAILCPSKPPSFIGLLVCFTPLGNCNGIPWPLPMGPSDLTGAVNFYNTVTLGDMVPRAAAAGQPNKVLCYDECNASFDWMRGCPAIFGGLKSKADHDPCKGLPTDNCVSAKTLADAAIGSPSSPSSSTSPAPTATGAAKGNGATSAVAASGSIAAAAALAALAAM
ncbi:hypothetical protein BC828DRAFT_415280, partial [Blastocladiella britannica]